jgi:hypothetical protein
MTRSSSSIAYKGHSLRHVKAAEPSSPVSEYVFYCSCPEGRAYLNPADRAGVWRRDQGTEWSGPSPVVVRDLHQAHVRYVKSVEAAREREAARRKGL